ncbi:ABC transporter ATP-binding protein [Paenibacillus sp. GCM10012307]|uniref:ABC transporter ATP-binding protein n=1 Tax=Paenibacillus roseus TaxID=2798579 RepID=A0A934MV72_9BACL|nr:ABC transporter ATP-binding protein [Paenibacillus roseus]MBJ6361812.1 ABC transporter ATP-binding protein [Paenibacillus roseus]
MAAIQVETIEQSKEHLSLPTTESSSTTPGKEVVSLSAVGLSYGDGKQQREILRDVHLQIVEGEFVCVLGASGSGKTSLLRMIAGYEQPTAGQIKLFGRPHLGPDRQVGVVFQHANLFPWLNVRGNVEFGLRMQGIRKVLRRERAADAIERVGLAHAAKLMPHQLSGGMKQRVAIARSMVTEPELMLMDEPFAALDAITREALQVQVRELWQQSGKTALFITHDVDEALFLGDRIIVMGGSPGGIATEMRSPLGHRTVNLSETRSANGYAKVRDQLIQLLKQES